MLGSQTVKDFEDEAKRLFKDEPAKMKLLIVVDKLLTGFDAPSATYLYVDKSMHDHDLFQAICRVNRPDDPSKDYGYIVDYKDLFRSVQSAFADYTSEAFEGYDKEDVEGLIKQRALEAKAKMEGARDSLRQLLSEVPAPRDDAAHIRFFCEPPAAEDEADADSRKRNTFYGLVSALTRSFADCADRLVTDFNYTDADVAQIRSDVHNYNQLKDAVMLAAGDWIDLRSYQEDMRFILDTYVTAQDSTVVSKLDDTPLVELLLDNASTTPEETENYPDQIRDSQAKRALYDFAQEKRDLEGLDIEDVALQLHLAIVDSVEVGWLANRAKQQRIKNAIAQTLEDYELLEPRIDQLVEEIYELVTRQEEYFDD